MHLCPVVVAEPEGATQVLDLTIAVAKVGGDADYVEPILQAALDGLSPAAA